MAPGTTIGAAHPVAIGGLPIGPQQDAEEGESPGGASLDKIVNDTASWARSISERRGRDADWAERTVRESLSVTASEALEAGAVDLVAGSLTELLEALDGRKVDLALGERELRTAGARVEEVSMWWGEGLLALIANPNVAFLLLLFGFYGIVYELTSPGFGVPGVLGVICFVLAMFGLAMLPVSWLGLGLILLALALFVAEAFVTSFGLLGLAGAVCLVFGGLMLVDSPAGFTRVSLAAALPGAAATALITIFLVTNVLRAHRRAPLGGSDSLVRELAHALEDFAGGDAGYAGQVHVHGERWRARSSGPILAGQRCSIEGREGLVLTVRPALEEERHA
jgi:membrane-bound serine protease (ClpP class)